jgi:hypothetical protein
VQQCINGMDPVSARTSVATAQQEVNKFGAPRHASRIGVLCGE